MLEAESILTDAEVSQILKVPVKAVQNLARLQRLRGKKVGRHWRFRAEWIREYMNATQEVPTRAALAAQDTG